MLIVWGSFNTKSTKHFLKLNPFDTIVNRVSANPRKWSNTLLQTNCLSIFDHFEGLALKGSARNTTTNFGNKSVAALGPQI